MPQTFSPQTIVTPAMAAPAGEVLPVLPGDFRGAQRAREDGELHLDLLRPAVLRLRVDQGEQGRVGPGLHALGQALGADGVALDAQVGVVQGVVLVGAGGHVAEFRGIEHLAAPERREPDLAAAPAAVHAARADARHGDHAPRAVKGPRRLVCIGLPQVHTLVLLPLSCGIKKRRPKPSFGRLYPKSNGFVTRVTESCQALSSTPREMMIASAIWRRGRRMFMLICCIFR